MVLPSLVQIEKKNICKGWKTEKMRAEGFEPTHPKIPECFVTNPPKSGALNHSAKLPCEAVVL